MTCVCDMNDGASLVRLSGDVDASSARTLATLEADLRDRESIVFDVSGVDHVDTTFLTFLVRLTKRINNLPQSTPIELLGVKPNLRRILEVTGLSRSFRVLPELRAAKV